MNWHLGMWWFLVCPHHPISNFKGHVAAFVSSLPVSRGPFYCGKKTGFVLHLSEEDMVLGLLWARVHSCAAFQWCGTDITDHFLLPFFCTMSRVTLTAIWFFFYHSVFLMFIVEIADKFRHTWLMTYWYLLSKNTSWNKISYVVKEILISWAGWWNSSFMVL